MHRNFLILALCSSLLALAGCEKKPATSVNAKPISDTTAPAANTGPAIPKYDVCALLTGQEIQSIQGSPIKETKGSERSADGVRNAQCFFTAEEFSKSISLSLTQIDPVNPKTTRSPKQTWAEAFHHDAGEEKEREGEKERRSPPKKITGIGDEAFWTGNAVGGSLYVLQKDVFIRISIGGSDNVDTKIEKLKTLAQKAIERLSVK